MSIVRAVFLAGAFLPQCVSAQSASAPGVVAQVAPQGGRQATSPLAPDTVLEPVGGPRLVLLRSPGVGIAAMRLAVPFREGAAEAGVGRLLTELALERMRALARPVGAQVSASRTPWGLAYAVVGAAADFEYLAYLLREAVSAPDVTGAALPEARLRLEGAAAATVETPARRIAAELRAQIAPGVPPLDGTPESFRALDAVRVRAAWLRSHQGAAMTLVVSAPVVPEVVLAATRGMGAPGDAAAAPPNTPVPSATRPPAPQVLRSWYGEARSLPAPRDPRGAVLARLVAQRLRKPGAGMEAAVELWDLPDRSVLAVIGSSWPRNAQAMRRSVSDVLALTRDALDDNAVAGAVAGARRELMLATRSPAGLVAVVGHALEAQGDPLAAAREFEALAGVDAAAVRALLDQILAQRPRTAEVRP